MSKAIQGQGEILGDPKMSSHFVEEAGPLDVPLRPVLSWYNSPSISYIIE